MSSLRGRLSALVAIGLFIVTAAAATGVVFERWQEDQLSVRDDVEIATFRLSEDDDPIPPTVSISGGQDSFAVVFDEAGEVIGESERLPNAVINELVNEIWSLTTEEDLLVAAELGTEADPLVVAGTRCIDEAVCDTVVVGTRLQPFAPYVVRRLGWIIGAASLAAAVGLFAARWLVGRSLQPVDQMRSELDAITASHITTADLERRVPIPTSGDELTRLGTSMNATLDRLGSAVAANERFVADAAHELRSPITGVRAALEVQRAKQPGSLVDDSITELDRAARLVDDLLVLARRQASTPRYTDVDLDDLARTAVANLRARQPDVQFDLRLSPCRVRGDVDGLQRVVTNLLDNAAHYGAGTITVTTTSEPNKASLSVGDNGPGIAPENRAIVFERFARLDASRARATGGSGLGLAIAKELVNDHGGTIQVTDSELGGALFAVSLTGATDEDRRR